MRNMHLYTNTLTVLVVISSFGLAARASPFSDAFTYTGNDPDVDRSLIDVIKSKGYPAESHEVQTDDGYILTLTRISHGRNQLASAGRPAALLVHGIYASTGTWVANFPENSLGYILADQGYDVWMACLRGCPLSRKHVSYSTQSHKFWDFSWDDIGLHDLPAFVDYILSTTGNKKLQIVAHSMGTSASFTLLSLKPEYNSKVTALVALAPISNMTHSSGMLHNMMPFGDFFNNFRNTMSYGEITFDPSIRKAMEVMCGLPLIKLAACGLNYQLGDGMESLNNFNQTRLPVYIAHVLGAASSKQLNHYSQVGLKGRFARYDYGTTENINHYGQSIAPAIPVEKISIPIALYHSNEDILGDPQDVATLRTHLKNVVKDSIPTLRPWTHMDFVLGIQAKQYVYDDVVKVMKQYK